MASASSAISDSKDGRNSGSRVPEKTTLYVPVKDTQWPIVYSSVYNIGFCKLEKLHPFDAGKWGRVFEFLKEKGLVRDDTVISPNEATEEDLLVVHTKDYLHSLTWSVNVARIAEVPPVAFLPNFIVQRKVLKPFRYQTGGTILATKMAVERGWGINIGGGFHHCSSDNGGGFCAYADITLAIKFAFDKLDGIKKAMIIDLDAHQGNGHERDFMNDSNVYILDVFNRGIYPHDGFAKRGIKRKVELRHYTEDAEYLSLVSQHVQEALDEFTPDLIVYNAGTDILIGDPLGCLSITDKGIIERDRIVFEKARKRKIPIVMVTSGGYTKETAKIIADSILNLRKEDLIDCEKAEKHQRASRASKMKKSLSEGSGFLSLLGFGRSSSTTELNEKSSDSTAKKLECEKIDNSGKKYTSPDAHCKEGTPVDVCQQACSIKTVVKDETESKPSTFPAKTIDKNNDEPEYSIQKKSNDNLE